MSRCGRLFRAVGRLSGGGSHRPWRLFIKKGLGLIHHLTRSCFGLLVRIRPHVWCASFAFEIDRVVEVVPGVFLPVP